MCGLCGLFGSLSEWSDPIKVEGEPFAQTRMKQIEIINKVLESIKCKISDFYRTSYILSTPTGATIIINNLEHLWFEIDKLYPNNLLDPLNLNFLNKLDI